MKKYFLLAGLLLIGSSFVRAEESQTAAITKEAMLTSKKAVIAQNLALTPEEEKGFWPAYADYQIGLNKLNDEYAALIKKFAVNYQTLDDELATSLVDQFFKMEKETIKHRMDGVDKFRKIIAPKKVTRFVQIENKLNSMARAELAQQIPLAK